MSDPIRKALAELVTLHLDESQRQPGDDADAWSDAWAAARAALAEQPEPSVQVPSWIAEQLPLIDEAIKQLNKELSRIVAPVAQQGDA